MPIPGTGCARPRLLGLGPGRPMLLSGGRMCVANTTGLFVWINPSGLPEGNWTRYSLSYQHNRLAPHPSWRFDEEVNASDYFETQAYTSLLQVGAREAFVVYQRYWDHSEGPHSTGYGMRISLPPAKI